MNVLIVDEAVEIRRRLRDAVSALPGVTRVDEAAGVADAIEAVEVRSPSVVILNAHLRRGSGLAVLGVLRALRQRIVVIVLANDPTTQGRRICLQAGADFIFDTTAEWQRAIDVVSGLAAGAAAVPGPDRRHALEDALRDSDERYRDLFENAPDALFTTDLSLNFTSINRVAETLIGYTRAEAVALNVAAVVTPEAIEVARRKLVEQLRGGPVAAHEAVLVTKDARRVPIEVTARVVYRDGRAVGTQGIARDISDRKRFEQERRQAQKMEAIGRLAGGVAHDFGNLLTVIMGQGQQILERLSPDDPGREDVLGILDAGRLATDLTRQLLAFGRQQVLEPRRLDLNAVVNRMAPMMRRLIREGVVLSLRLTPDDCSVEADPAQLEQVIMNLAVNARDAMPDGGTLTIQTLLRPATDVAPERSLPTGEYVVLVVRDTGQGMDAATKARLFEPFFTTKDLGRGTGLGLSTVYGIVKQSGGNIVVDSTPGAGTVFRLYFPRRPEQRLPSAPARAPACRAGLPCPDGSAVVPDARG